MSTISLIPELHVLQAELDPEGTGTTYTTSAEEVPLHEELLWMKTKVFMLPAPPNPNWGKLLPEWNQQLLDLVNTERRSRYLNSLVIDQRLQDEINWKTLNCAGYLYMDHNTPDPAWPGGRTISDRMLTYYPANAAWGENLAYGFVTAQTVFDAWMSDYGHRENILNTSWYACGMAAAQATNGLIFQGQDFGYLTPGPPTPPPVPVDHPRVGQFWINKKNGTGIEIKTANDKIQRVAYINEKTGMRGHLTYLALNQRYKLVA